MQDKQNSPTLHRDENSNFKYSYLKIKTLYKARHHKGYVGFCFQLDELNLQLAIQLSLTFTTWSFGSWGADVKLFSCSRNEHIL